jgi:hypothetical protein
MIRLRGAIGSAFDSKSKGCVFESRRGQCFLKNKKNTLLTVY